MEKLEELMGKEEAEKLRIQIVNEMEQNGAFSSPFSRQLRGLANSIMLNRSYPAEFCKLCDLANRYTICTKEDKAKRSGYAECDRAEINGLNVELDEYRININLRFPIGVEIKDYVARDESEEAINSFIKEKKEIIKGLYEACSKKK